MQKLLVTLVVSLLFIWPLVAGAQQQGTPQGAAPPQQKADPQVHKGEANKPFDQAAMREIEARLKAAGFDPGRVDGTFTAETDKALREYQRKHGLRLTGLVGDDTLKSLMAAQAPTSGSAPAKSPGAERAPAAAPVGKTTPGESTPAGTTR